MEGYMGFIFFKRIGFFLSGFFYDEDLGKIGSYWIYPFTNLKRHKKTTFLTLPLFSRLLKEESNLGLDMLSSALSSSIHGAFWEREDEWKNV